MNTGLLSATAILVAGAGLSLFALPGTSKSAQGNAEAVAVAAGLNLVPESLVIAGLTSSADVNGILSRVDAAEAAKATHSDARVAVDEAGSALSTTATLVLLDAGDEALVSQHTGAIAAVDAAEKQLAAATKALLTEALEGVASTSIDKILVWRASAARAVPAEFRTALRSDQEWLAIEVALRAEQRAEQLGIPLKPDAAEILDQVRSEPQVIQAQIDLLVHLNAVKDIFTQYHAD